MRIKSVVFDEKGCILFLGVGKTFQRRVRIVAFSTLLHQYIENHPFRNDPLFSPLADIIYKPSQQAHEHPRVREDCEN
jgi:hypothetical protein